MKREWKRKEEKEKRNERKGKSENERNIEKNERENEWETLRMEKEAAAKEGMWEKKKLNESVQRKADRKKLLEHKHN